MRTLATIVVIVVIVVLAAWALGWFGADVAEEPAVVIEETTPEAEVEVEEEPAE